LHVATETPSEPYDRDADLIEGLRNGDERAFADLLDRYGASMLRVAQMIVRSRAVAEEVVQESLVGVLTGIKRFEGRSLLRTWLFRIVTNRARTRAERERRSLPFSSLVSAELEDTTPEVAAERFLPADHETAAGAWAIAPRSWAAIPEDKLLARETVDLVAAAIEMLPPVQREVIRLRDVEGWEAAEVAAALEISDGNQRVLLHRARSAVRQALENHLEAAA
jgi:RNA polymerase sigma-70 factor (ECF subfamily)